MVVKLILAALATYRLAQLIAWDSGPGYSLKWLRIYINNKYQDEGGMWENIDEGINCPYCLGIYFALFCLILLKKPSRIGDFILYWFGIAGGQALMQGITKGR